MTSSVNPIHPRRSWFAPRNDPTRAFSKALVNQISAKNPAKPWEPKFVIRNFDLAIGIKQGEPRLLAKLNEWVAANLKNGKLGAIYKKYYNVDLPASMTN